MGRKTAADFFRHRGGDAQPADLKAFLAIAPDVPAEPGDEIPEHLKARLERDSHVNHSIKMKRKV